MSARRGLLQALTEAVRGHCRVPTGRSMTAVNFVYTPDQACIVTDSLISGPRPQHASKVLALPHIRSVIAFTGAFLVFADLAAVLLAADVRDADGLIERLPEMLRALRDRWGGAQLPPTSVYAFGIDAGDRVRVAAFPSETDFGPRTDWRPWVAYCTPLPAALTSAEAPAGEAPTASYPAAAPAPRARPSRRDCVRAIIDAVEIQRRAHPASIGGRLIVTFLTADAIHQTVLREL